MARRISKQRSSLFVDSLESRRLFAVAYGIVDLAPDTGGVAHTGRAYGISNDGTKIAMQYDGHAAVRKNGVITDLGFNGYAMDVNNAGVVCGVDTSTGQSRPFVWKDGVKTILSLDGNTTGYANAINNSGAVVGSFSFSGYSRAFVAALGGAAKSIGTPSGVNYISATGINDNGQIIGNLTASGGGPRAFIYSSNTFKTIANLPGGESSRTQHGLTSGGTLAVSGPSLELYNGGPTKEYHVYTIGSNGYGSPVDKGTYSNFYDVGANDIDSNGGVIVADNNPGLFDSQGMVNRGSGFDLIENLIDPAKGWERISSAEAVADNGKIVGYGYNSDGQMSPYLLEPIAPATYFISGRVWNDTDGDGVFDSGESASGVRTVFIDNNANGKLDSGEKNVQSNSNGEYSFTGLANGTYNVTRVLPSGYRLSNGTAGKNYLAVTLSGASKVNVNLGSAAIVTGTATITGFVFNDTDKDGIFDDSESASGVRTVFIDANGNKKLDAGEKSVQSNSEGRYTFTGLTAGTYKVTRVFPSGYKLSNNNDGFVNVTVAAGQTKTVNLGSRTV
ncbi:MAG: SdrD B-like domain-containing protein [Tepidisphaeraceae bacterium]